MTAPPSSNLTAALLIAEAGPESASSAARVAAAAEGVWTRLAQRFAMLIGEGGIRAIQARTVVSATARFPWMGPAAPPASLWTALAAQPVAEGLAGFAELVANLIALLGRFIGDALVSRLLHDLWPDVFSRDAKELE